jgi:hypothetical protein
MDVVTSQDDPGHLSCLLIEKAADLAKCIEQIVMECFRDAIKSACTGESCFNRFPVGGFNQRGNQPGQVVFTCEAVQLFSGYGWMNQIVIPELRGYPLFFDLLMNRFKESR